MSEIYASWNLMMKLYHELNSRKRESDDERVS